MKAIWKLGELRLTTQLFNMDLLFSLSTHLSGNSFPFSHSRNPRKELQVAFLIIDDIITVPPFVQGLHNLAFDYWRLTDGEWQSSLIIYREMSSPRLMTHRATGSSRIRPYNRGYVQGGRRRNPRLIWVTHNDENISTYVRIYYSHIGRCIYTNIYTPISSRSEANRARSRTGHPWTPGQVCTCICLQRNGAG